MNDKVITGMLVMIIVGLLILAATTYVSVWEDLGRRVVEEGLVR